ncbi:hypothetical protein XENTR_v10004862 [Xenopus tropicalis]|nr:hypothetical protein XENTR_v10004862 [Xenopus tropicalis]
MDARGFLWMNWIILYLSKTKCFPNLPKTATSGVDAEVMNDPGFLTSALGLSHNSHCVGGYRKAEQLHLVCVRFDLSEGSPCLSSRSYAENFLFSLLQCDLRDMTDQGLKHLYKKQVSFRDYSGL